MTQRKGATRGFCREQTIIESYMQARYSTTVNRQSFGSLKGCTWGTFMRRFLESLEKYDKASLQIPLVCSGCPTKGTEDLKEVATANRETNR